MERLIIAGHLIRYIREVDHGEEYAPTADRTTAGVAAPFESRPTISYVLGGPFDDQYQSKHQQKKLLRAATIKAWVNTGHAGGSWEETNPIDDPISFPIINPNRAIVPHYDALVLTLCISSFEVHRELIDLSSAADLLQLPRLQQNEAFLMNVELGRTSPLWFQQCNDHDTRRHHTSCASRTSHPTCFVPSHPRPRSYNAIVVRTWLHSMKVVSSMYHQSVSYLKSSEQVDLLSRQLAARQCYQLTLREHRGKCDSEQPPLDDQTPA